MQFNGGSWWVQELQLFSQDMALYPFISLVIPCFNELARWDHLSHGVLHFSKGWPGEFEVILVDDGSTDGGLNDNNQLAEWDSKGIRYRVLTQTNQGKGKALQTGVMAALGDFVLTLDADMATQPTELMTWWQKRGRFYEKEILIGSRELRESVVSDSWKRKVVGRVFNRLIRWMTGLPYRDTQCGFKLYPAHAAKALFGALQTAGWSHDVELLLRANRMGFAVVQMPIVWHAIPGSKISVLRDSMVMFKELIRIVLMRI